ncbi:RNA polymerase sigma factor [Duganella rhizosphaerae]|uniref:RNA polymerase sigma factor n=1 Tax=Duganella rhizosphaerae TaxID=2885763 RepID=UPI0030EA4B2E
MQDYSSLPLSPDIADAELAQRVAAGQRGAFELLMRRHNQALYRAARSILRHDHDAEDALQDAYLLAFRAIGTYRSDARLATWLTRIVINVAIARARQGRRRAEVVQLDGGADLQPDQTGSPMDNPDSDTPERAAMRAQMRQLLEQHIDDLPDVYRTVFVLRAVEEMSGDEVAACLDIPAATVRSRFFRARSLLRSALALEVDAALESAYAFDGARCDRIVAGVLARLEFSGKE